MHKHTLPLIFLMAAAALPVCAETAIPAKIRDHILIRHPQATELQASEENHFGNKLLKVAYKENDTINMELFKSSGALFSNVFPVEDPTPLPPELLNTLKREFADYQFKKAERVVNPNGVGEEYAVYLVAKGNNWLVSINDNGQILGKSNY